MKSKLSYLVGYGLATMIEIGVLTTTLYHVNKLLVWLEISVHPMQFSEALLIGILAVLIVEIVVKLKRKADE